MSAGVKPSAPATERNRSAILDVLREEFQDVATVLEIGSGTGQHAVFFAEALPHLTWQTSDRAANHDGIRAWIEDARIDNVKSPLDIDVLQVRRIGNRYDAVFSANTAHIMSYPAVREMFRLVGGALEPGGLFCLYGPFNLSGEFTSDSNRAFDASLKAQDECMGIRDLDDLLVLGKASGLQEVKRFAMPANNMLVVWRKSSE